MDARSQTEQAWRALYDFDDILGESESLRHAVWLGKRAAEGGYATLLIGESGVGKELFAHAIHNASPTRDGPFVPVNCGTLPGELALIELCGSEPGSFTGADRRTHVGILDIADQGTLFLDELQDLSHSAQSVLLRFLETGTFVRVGGTRPTHSSVRVVGALNLSLAEVEQRGMLRSDLIYRLSCLTIEIAPLRERPEDIRPIAERTLSEELHFDGRIDDEVWEVLARCPYPWPGNARGLRNILLKAILSADGAAVTVDDLPQEVWRPARNGAHRRWAERAEVVYDADTEALVAVLRATRGNVSEAARRLGVHRATIYRRMERFGIDPRRLN